MMLMNLKNLLIIAKEKIVFLRGESFQRIQYFLLSILMYGSLSLWSICEFILDEVYSFCG